MIFLPFCSIIEYQFVKDNPDTVFYDVIQQISCLKKWKVIRENNIITWLEVSYKLFITRLRVNWNEDRNFYTGTSLVRNYL